MQSPFPYPSPPGLKGRQLLPLLRTIQQDAPGFLMAMQERFGEIVSFEVGNKRAYFINHPNGIQHILQDNSHNYSKDTIQYNKLAAITGKGLLTSDGPLWLRQRRLEQPAFSPQRLNVLDRVVVPAVSRMLERWEETARHAELLDIDSEMMRLSLEVVGKALFNIDLSASAGHLATATSSVLDNIVNSLRHPIRLPRLFPIRQNLKFQAALSTLDAVIYNLMAERRDRDDLGEDVLGVLLRARDEETGQPLDEKQVRDEIITLLIAGHETVASALTWCWYLLAKHPLVWERMRAETLQTLEGRQPASADLENLTYTGWVFDETLRLYPPTWVITRKVLEADEVMGYHLETGALVIISPYTIHRHPHFWSDPERFAPVRFSIDHEKNRPRFAYLPFGGGPRLCLGRQFALHEAHLILAMVTQHFRLEMPENAGVKADALVTLRPHGGLPMRPVIL